MTSLVSAKYWRAANMALHDLLAEDDRRVLLGQDVASPGGPYGLTRNLLRTFGPERVRDTPISEAAIMGAATGAAMAGLKPIVEIMFFDFITLALDQLVNNAAKIRYYTGNSDQSMSIVVHTLYGGRAGMGAQHSQSFESWLANVPGLNVAFPSSPDDVYGILKVAATLPQPTVVVSAIALLTTAGDVTLTDGASDAYAPGRATRLLSGDRATVVSYGPVARVCLDVLDGMDVDLLDLRWISPWDVTAVLESVKQTNRLIIVHDAVQQAGFGAEVAATVAERGVWHLDAPIVRVGGKFTPVPSREADWAEVLPNADAIRRAVKEVIEC